MTSPSDRGEEAELAARLEATDAPPGDPGGAVAALTPSPVAPGDTESPSAPEAPPRRGPGRPRKSEVPQGAAKVAPQVSAPAPKKGRATRAELEARVEQLQNQVAILSPDSESIRRAAQALEGTLAIAGAMMGEQLHPTLDISPKAGELASIWAPVLAPHMESFAEQLPYLAAAAATVTILLPNYRAYRAAMLESGEGGTAEVIPGPVAEGLGVVPIVGIRPRGAES